MKKLLTSLLIAMTVISSSFRPVFADSPETPPEPTNEIIEESVAEELPETNPEIIPEQEVTPEPTPEQTPEAEPTPVTTPEPAPVVTPEITPEPSPEPTPTATPELTPEPTAEPTTETEEVVEEVVEELEKEEGEDEYQELILSEAITLKIAGKKFEIEPFDTGIEAYLVTKTGNVKEMIVHINKDYDLRKGEYASLYGMDHKGNLFDYPVAEHLKAGDEISLPTNWYKGFAIVQEGKYVPVTEIRPSSIPDGNISDITIFGDDLEGVEMVLSPKSGIDTKTLFSYDISLYKDEGEYQPGSPVTVSVTSPMIGSAVSEGCDIGISHLSDHGYEEIIPESVQGNTVTFKAGSFSTYDFYKVGETVSVTVSEEVKTVSYDKTVIVSAPETVREVYWEIAAPDGDVWGIVKNGRTLEVTYAMVAEFGGSAKVRYAGLENEEEVTGDPVLVTIEGEEGSYTAKRTETQFVKTLRIDEQYAELVDAGNADTYNVVVNYVFTDGSIAQEPTIATIAAGEDFETDISITQLIGYESYLEGEASPRTSFHISIQDISSNHTFTVTYRPALVQYTVEHYWQDIYSDNYIIHESETFEGYTGDVIENVENNYSGMFALLYDHPTIAADGSTVVSVYYDRFYYLMNYDLQGGKGVDPVYARYQTPVTVGTPSRVGYIFAGWSPEVPATIPVGGGTYTAQWTPLDTTYTLIFWYENAGPEETYAIMESSERTAPSGTDIYNYDYRNQAFPGRDDTYFTYDTDKNEHFIIEGDGTTNVNVYFRRNVVTMNFHYSNTTMTFSGKYGSSFASYGYSWPDDAKWRFTNTSGGNTTMSFMDAFIPTETMPNKLNIDFYTTSTSGHVLAFYKQKADGSYATNNLADADVRIESGGTFTITEKFEGYHAKDYRHSTTEPRYAWLIGSSEGEEYTGDDFYSETTSSSGTQYGVVDGEIVRLQNGMWIKNDGTPYEGAYVYAETTASSGDIYGVVDGNIYPVTTGYWYTNASGVQVAYEGGYFYTETTGNTGTQYGLVDGGMLPLYRSNGYLYEPATSTAASFRGYYWNGSGFTNATIYYNEEDGIYYRTRSGWWDYTYSNPVDAYTRTRSSGYSYYADGHLYEGTRYTQSTSSTSTYAYGLVNGVITQLTRGMIANGKRYTGTRYTQRSSQPAVQGTYFGFENGEMIPVTADTSSWYARGSAYTGTRYTSTTSPSSTGTYYGMSNGVMERLYYTNISDGWTSWEPVIAGTTKITSDNNTYQIRFARTSYSLRFTNHNTVITDREEELLFGADLSPYEFTPDYPDDLPYDKYYFAGWYDNEALQGSPFNFNSEMPSNDLMLFAKWEPKLYTVNIYKNITDMEAGRNVISSNSYPYGTLAPTPVSPEDEKYTFTGWFYQNDYGDEIPFQFSTTVITKDISIYGKWTSEVLVTYTIRYEDEEGNAVADPFVSSAIEGSSRTFKATDELYPQYQRGYFPLVSSHSILFDSEGINDYTFVYRHLENLPYTVRYVDDRTGEALLEDKFVEENEKIAVTEKFIPIQGYVPDRFQKTLVLQVEDTSQNVLTFRYTKDTAHAYYLESHYIEKPDGTWKLYNSLDVLEDIGKTVTISPMTIDGYTYDEDNVQNVKQGTVSETGLELKLYYELNSYNYKVRYLDYRTNEVLAPEKIASGKYSTKVSETEIPIDRYECVTSSPQEITITKDDENPKRNVITFYYQLAQATFDYVPVGGGSVSLNREIVAALTGLVEGSSPVYDSDQVEFMGWFYDEEGTEPVEGELVDENDKITPVKQFVDGKWRFVSETFYALFGPKAVPVKIVKVDSKVKSVTLPGAHFTLKLNGEFPEVIEDGQPKTIESDLVSDEDGVVFEGSLYISPSAYQLKETVAADKHYLLEDTINITVTQGNISVSGSDKVSVQKVGNTFVITVENDEFIPVPTSYNARNSTYSILLLAGFALLFLVLFTKHFSREKN